MKRFKNILLICDTDVPDAPTIKRALELAKDNGAALRLVDTVKPIDQKSSSWTLDFDQSDLEKMLVEDKQKKIDGLIAQNKNSQVAISGDILVGKRLVSVLREVVNRSHDLVILTAEGKQRFKDQIFGTTALHILRKCPCPVWVMKPKQGTQYKRVLAAVKSDPHESDIGQLDRMVMDLATSLSRIEGAKLDIVHAWSAYAESLLEGRSDVSATKVAEYVDDVEASHDEALNKLLASYELNDIKHEVHSRKGEPGEIISEIAHETKVDVIVMGTLSRSGVQGMLIGNTAEKILQRVDCSIVAVKPEGFKAPFDFLYR